MKTKINKKKTTTATTKHNFHTFCHIIKIYLTSIYHVKLIKNQQQDKKNWTKRKSNKKNVNNSNLDV